ncbi:uncharacterized protein LOC144037668 isoform X2 [Vanacampus margaritifer]
MKVVIRNINMLCFDGHHETGSVVEKSWRCTSSAALGEALQDNMLPEASTIKEYCLYVGCCPSTCTSAEEKWRRVVKRIEAVWDMDGSVLQACNWKAAFRQDGRKSWCNTQPTDSRLFGHVGWVCTPLTASCLWAEYMLEWQKKLKFYDLIAASWWSPGEVASQREQIVRP